MLLLYLMESRWCREEPQTGRPQFARYEDKHCFITVICSQARAPVSAREKIYAERLSRKVNGKVGVGWGGWDGAGAAAAHGEELGWFSSRVMLAKPLPAVVTEIAAIKSLVA